MTNFDPGKTTDIETCHFLKHRDRLWENIVDEDSAYVHWLISGEGPDMKDDLCDFLTNLLEDHDQGFL
jgi:hypothetical protein